MAYNLHDLLSPQDFELISRDLLQASTNCRFESFKEGKDNGIDIRCASSTKGKIIVQAKRYKGWSALRNALTNEVDKVKKLSPDKYILTTTVPLSPDNKAVIKAMFDPYIKEVSDIYGNEDLNNLINQHKDIERQYYQLWMASTNVLDTIVNADIVNATGFERERIVADIRMFVDNESTVRALKILQDNSYVIISGVPGIGKTTLARFLSYKLLSEGWQDFVFVESLKEAKQMFLEGRKQIFFYDDFLGSTTYNILERSFDSALTNFIDAIKRRKDKLLILTTREYILSEAKGKLEKLANANFEIAKCVIDLGSYTKTIRAKILYNHLAFSSISQECIEELISTRGYMRIIEHRNYNPRIIETFVDREEWKNVGVDKFVTHFIGLFDNPYKVWGYAYEALMREAQFALLILLTMGKDVRLRDWRQAFKYFAEKTSSVYELRLDEGTWNAALRVLSGCFVMTDRKWNVDIVNFYNPSVNDFLVNYLNKNMEYRNDLIWHACFPNQIVTVFSDRRNATKSSAYVIINEEAYSIVIDTFKRFLLTTEDPFGLLYALLRAFPDLYRKNDTLIANWLKPEFFDANILSVYNVKYVLSQVGKKLPFPMTDIMLNKVLLSCESLSEYEEYCSLAQRYDIPIDTEYVSSQVECCVDAYMSSYSSPDEIEDDKSILDNLAEYDVLVSANMYKQLETKASSFEDDFDEDDYKRFKESSSIYERAMWMEDKDIHEMFGSLKY